MPSEGVRFSLVTPTLTVVLSGLLPGCTYGFRGGPSAMFNSTGVVSPGGGVTTGVGLADDSGALRGFHMTASLYNIGYDLAGDGVAAAGGGGIEYFQQSQGESHGLGFRAGAEGGGGVSPRFDFVVIGASVGVRYAFVDDREFPFLDLGGIIGGGLGIENEAGTSSPSGVLGIVNLSIGWLRVNPFKL